MIMLSTTFASQSDRSRITFTVALMSPYVGLRMGAIQFYLSEKTGEGRNI